MSPPELTHDDHDGLSPTAQTRRRWRRLRIVAAISTVIILAGGLHVYIAYRPERVRELALKGLQTLTTQPVEYVEIREGASRREVWIEHVSVNRPGASTEELRVRRIVVRAKWLPLLFGRLEVEEVVFIEPELTVTRQRDGRLSSDGLFDAEKAAAALGLGETRWSVPMLRIHDGVVHYFDKRPNGAAPRTGAPGDLHDLPPLGPRQELAEIQASVYADDGGEALRIEATARSLLSTHLSLEGEWRPNSRRLDVKFQARRVDLSGALGSWFQAELGLRESRREEVSGVADLGAVFHIGPEGEVVVDTFSARLLGCRVKLATLPLALERLTGEVVVSRDRLVARDLKGWIGDGALEIRRVELGRDPRNGMFTGIDAEFMAQAIELDRRVWDWLPESLRGVERWNPRGRARIAGEIHAPRLPPRPGDFRLELELEDVTFVPREFPVPLDGFEGRIAVEGGRAEVSLRSAKSERGPLTVTGWWRVDEPDRYNLEVHAEGVELREAWGEALPAVWVRRWKECQPRGECDASLTLRGRDASAPATAGPREARLSIRPRACRLLHHRVPSEIRDIEGELVVDFLAGRLELVGLHGRRDGRPMMAEGSIALAGDGQSQVKIIAEDVTLDDELVAAASPRVRRLLGDLGLRGEVQLLMLFTRDESRAQRRKIEIRPRRLSATLGFFPYPVRVSGGLLVLESEDLLELKALELSPMPIGDESGAKTEDADFEPAATELMSATATLNGKIVTVGGERTFSYVLGVKGLGIDERLRAALPNELGRIVDALDLAGRVDAEIEGTYSYDIDRPSLSRALYEIREFSVEDGKASLGPTFYEVQSSGSLRGSRDYGGHHQLKGEFLLASARFNRLRLQDLHLRLAYGLERCLFRDALDETEAEANRAELAEWLSDRLRGEKARSVLQVQVLSAGLYGGKVTGELFVDTRGRRDLGGRLQAEGVRVERSVRDVFGVEDSESSGRTDVHVEFRGTVGDLMSLHGSGEVTVREGELTNLPLLVGFVGSLLTFRPTTKPRFREVDLKFKIEDGLFTAGGSSVEIRGDGLQLIGRGKLDFSGGLFLALTPHLTTFGVPGVELILNLVKKTLVQIWVEGTLEEPRVKLVTGAGFIRLPLGGSSEDSEKKENDG